MRSLANQEELGVAAAVEREVWVSLFKTLTRDPDLDQR